MKLKRLAVLALFPLIGGCTLPDSPDRSTWDPAIVVNARWDANALVFDVTGDGWFQVLLNTDDNTSTGIYRQGAEYETCTDLEVRGDSAAVRATLPSDPTAPGGWGKFEGWSVTRVIGRREREMRIPLSALGTVAPTVRYFVWLEMDVQHAWDREGSVSKPVAFRPS